MSDARDTFASQVETELNRLACGAVLDRSAVALAHLRGDLFSLAGRLASAPWPGLLPLAQALEQSAPNLKTTAQAGDLLTALGARWAQWRDGGPPAPSPDDAGVPNAADADELEVLRSDPEIAGMFIAEALDHLGTIEATVLQLESDPRDRKLLNDVFRPFHTIKGNAGALGVKSIQEFAHKVENLLDLGRSGALLIGRAEIDVILRSVDLLTSMIRDLPLRLAGDAPQDIRALRAELTVTLERLATGQAGAVNPDLPRHEATAVPAGGGLPAAAAPPPSARRTDMAGTPVKVDTRKLDNLVDMVGELVIVQSIISADPSLLGLADERLSRNLAQLRRITSDLQRNAMSMRMVPIKGTFQKMARLVRDLGRTSGKAVDLVLSGEDTELDRKVVEDINDPLMHMIRNSIDHGIEPGDVRLAAGKPSTGRVSLSARHQGGNVVIAIEDDGAGLNVERIMAKAVAQGLVRPGDALPPADVYQLIFRPGFSTAEKVTDISGRGVGMDVVRRNIEALRGRIEIQSAPGMGASFAIKLPLTLAIVEGLLLGVGGQRFVLPTFSIRESLRPSRDQVHDVQAQPRMIRVRDSLMPLVCLTRLFGVGPTSPAPWEATVVVIEDDGRRVALVVDELLGKQEVVIKSLGVAFAQVRGIAGGAILGDGRIGLILDAGGIISLATHPQSEAAA